VFLIVTAILIPILSAVYMWLCVAFLPGESLFGDISEPLPNGYIVEALGKMPDFANIKDPKSPWRYPKLTECVGKIAVDGPLVIGQYSHPCDAFTPKPVEAYFIFDTLSGETTELQTPTALQAKLGHPVSLTEVQFFRSPLAAARRKTNATVIFVPPFIALMFLVAFVWRARTRTDATTPNIYT
jgi:hypothetical protein